MKRYGVGGVRTQDRAIYRIESDTDVKLWRGALQGTQLKGQEEHPQGHKSSQRFQVNVHEEGGQSKLKLLRAEGGGQIRE